MYALPGWNHWGVGLSGIGAANVPWTKITVSRSKFADAGIALGPPIPQSIAF
jgi:hypothetical protein